MGQITVRFPAGEHSRFAPGALDGVVGTETKFNGQPAQILAARVLPDGWGEVTLETEAIGELGVKVNLTASDFSFSTDES